MDEQKKYEVIKALADHPNGNKERAALILGCTKRHINLSLIQIFGTYYIEHNRAYKGTAAHYDVSYSQVQSWVKKYYTAGEAGLTDSRGRHRTDDEVDELEWLRRENLRLNRQLEEKDMVVELLKKVKEFEGM